MNKLFSGDVYWLLANKSKQPFNWQILESGMKSKTLKTEVIYRNSPRRLAIVLYDTDTESVTCASAALILQTRISAYYYFISALLIITC